jgi:hypothetical protein
MASREVDDGRLDLGKYPLEKDPVDRTEAFKWTTTDAPQGALPTTQLG